jgi:superoxide dismutase, Fe-Mn family
MDRKDFLTTTGLLMATSILPNNNVFAHSVLESSFDKLTDEKGNFVLQPLPYNQNFLEPNMDEETVNLHYTFHHGGAVKGANVDMQKIQEGIAQNNFELADYWTKKLAHHFSSHLLHTIFWTNLTNKKTEPKGELLKLIEKHFTSYDKLKGLLSSVSVNVLGNGWGILGYHPYSKSLMVLECENHEKLTAWGIIPLLVIDVWEHAYYLKHRNKRANFVETVFGIINWDNVAERLDIALKMTK